MSVSDYAIVLVTASGRDEAEKIAAAVLEERKVKDARHLKSRARRITQAIFVSCKEQLYTLYRQIYATPVKSMHRLWRAKVIHNYGVFIA